MEMLVGQAGVVRALRLGRAAAVERENVRPQAAAVALPQPCASCASASASARCSSARRPASSFCLSASRMPQRCPPASALHHFSRLLLTQHQSNLSPRSGSHVPRPFLRRPLQGDAEHHLPEVPEKRYAT